MAYSGRYKPVNIEKYKGDWRKITYRSSWEHWFMRYLDNNKNIVKWNSECVIIPYFSNADGKKRRYFMDFWALYDNGQEFFFEVKPYKETQPPTKPANMTTTAKRRYINELYTYSVNTDKWKAAWSAAEKRNIKFRLLTENSLKKLGWRG